MAIFMVFFFVKEIDEKTDVLTDKAVDGVKKSVSSFFRYAAG